MKTEFGTAKYATQGGPGERNAEFIPLRTECPSQQSPRGSGMNSAPQWPLSRVSHFSRLQLLISK